MSVITPGTTFANGEQLTASDLNLLVQGASFNQNAVDNNTTILVGPAITVADGGITNAKLDANAVTTSKILDGEVTKAKIENVSAPLRVLGRMSTGAGVTEEVAVISDDELVGASATTLATSASIKTYVDNSTGGFTPSTYIGGESVTLPNGLIMKFGTVTVAINGNTTVTFDTNLDVFTGTVNAQLTPIQDSTADLYSVKVSSLSNTELIVRNTQGGTPEVYWQVIGY